MDSGWRLDGAVQILMHCRCRHVNATSCPLLWAWLRVLNSWAWPRPLFLLSANLTQFVRDNRFDAEQTPIVRQDLRSALEKRFVHALIWSWASFSCGNIVPALPMICRTVRGARDSPDYSRSTCRRGSSPLRRYLPRDLDQILGIANMRTSVSTIICPSLLKEYCTLEKRACTENSFRIRT